MTYQAGESSSFPLLRVDSANEEKNNSGVKSHWQHYVAKARDAEVISHAEAAELACQAKDGNEAAKEKLVDSHLRLVIHLVKRAFCWTGVDSGELVHAGVIGLIESIPHFDAGKARFSTFAASYIKASIIREFHENKFCLRVPRAMRDALKQYESVGEELCMTCEQPVSDEIILQVLQGRYPQLDKTPAWTEERLREVRMAQNIYVELTQSQLIPADEVEDVINQLPETSVSPDLCPPTPIRQQADAICEKIDNLPEGQQQALKGEYPEIFGRQTRPSMSSQSEDSKRQALSRAHRGLRSTLNVNLDQSQSEEGA